MYQLEQKLSVLFEIFIKALHFSRLTGTSPLLQPESSHNLVSNKTLITNKFEFQWFSFQSFYSLIVQILYVTITLWIIFQNLVGNSTISHLATRFDPPAASNPSNFTVAILTSYYVQYYVSGIALYLTTFQTTPKLSKLLNQWQLLFTNIFVDIKTYTQNTKADNLTKLLLSATRRARLITALVLI